MTVATAVSFDADLMRRYDREGPRYTSYPTALQFHEGIGVEDYARAAASQPRRTRRTSAVLIRAYSLLLQSLLLLRLQQGRHAST